MTSINFQGTTYLCPLSERFRRHTPGELAMLVESLRDHGLKHPVLLYRTADDAQPRVLDGEGRLTAAARLGDVAVRFDDLGFMTDDAAYDLAMVYNDHRRQDDPECVAKRKQERVVRTASFRVEGNTIDSIADREGVSRETVRNDIKEAVRQGLRTQPDVVKGKDGKSYPAKPRSKRAVSGSKSVKKYDKRAGREQNAESHLDDTPVNVTAPPAGKLATYYRNDGIPEMPGVYRPRLTKAANGQETVLDAYDNPMPAGLGDTFVDPSIREILANITSVANDAEQVREQFDKLKAARKAHQVYTWAEIPTVSKFFDVIRDTAVKLTDHLRDAIPYAVCPDCSGAKKGCKACRGSGYWPKSECEVYPERFRKGAAA